MMQTLKTINIIIAVIFTACYSYQFLYLLIPWIMDKRETHVRATLHDFAVLICARNESAVIGDLIDSIKDQTYPQSRIRVFVMADNCDDDTAAVAKARGAAVYTRFDKANVGKGFALEALLEHIKADYPGGFDGYFVFDADNILEQDYIEQMNRTFSYGNDVITSYRNSKNYGDNWISAGYSLWFLRESRYLNCARYLLGTSCAVSGTGFFFSRKVLEETGGWPFHLLTEDIEFSITQVLAGRKIAFCEKAVFYDEQPVSFRQSWKQRMRWARGYLQVFRHYGSALIKGIFSGNFSCYDMSMNIMPAFILSGASIICNLVLGIRGAATGSDAAFTFRCFLQMFGNTYFMLFALGLITTVSEWNRIRTSPSKKVLYAFTFPFFMMTYIPIAFTALFHKPEWDPIVHSVTAQEFRSSSGETIESRNRYSVSVRVRNRFT